MREPKHFAALRECSLEIHHLNSVLGLLHWDQETQMPHGAANVRSAQIAKMSELVHEKRASKTFKERLSKLISIETGKPKVKGITPMQKAALREWRKDYLRATRLPTSFVSAF
jgi:carboxypeptidase Taq